MTIRLLTKKYTYLLVLFCAITTHGQIDPLWTKVTNVQRAGITKGIQPSQQQALKRTYQLNTRLLKERLHYEQNTTLQNNKGTSPLISFPNYDGTFDEYIIVENSNFSEELQKKYPGIKSYRGINTKDSSKIIHFSFSQIGLHTLKKSHNETTFIEPIVTNEDTYKVFSKDEVAPLDKICNVHNDEPFKETSAHKTPSISGNNIARTFRLALSCTGEYAQFHLNDQNIPEDASTTEKKAAVLAAMNISLTRLNAVFQKELALKMLLVPNNDLLVFLNPETDGYTNDDDFKLIDEVAQKCDNLIGSANYDMGHLFTNGFSGLAELASICTHKKAKAVSGRTPSKGDAFDIDFVAHEMGHQFGANHTFSNDCGGNKNAQTAVEPGSGSTIMGYAGICAPNVQNNSDAYFHGISLEQMYYVLNTTNCATETSLNLPAPTADAGVPKYIPAGTAFALIGMGSSENDKVTYSWEQTNTGNVTMPPDGNSTTGPLFRSLPEQENPIRHFPTLATTLTGAKGSTWEQLPLVSRNLNFKLTTRNNDGTYGQFATANTIIAVIKTAHPFEISTQNNPTLYYSGESTTINWNVGETTQTPINSSHVNILLSTDGGYTFPIELASNTPNDGSETVTIPVVDTDMARIKIEAVGNIFYDINNVNFSIKPFLTNFENTTVRTCAPLNAQFNFNYLCGDNFNETTSFELEGLPQGIQATITPTSANTTNTPVVINIENIQNKHIGTHAINLVATAPSYTKKTALTLFIEQSVESAPYLKFPPNFATETNNNLTFSWESQSETNAYIFELATDIYFSDITRMENTESSALTIENIPQDTKYYWRVKEINSCEEGLYSSVYSFTTGTKENFTYSNTDEIIIPDGDTAGVNATITIDKPIKIIDINCTLNIEHSYVGDIELKLISPQGTSIDLKNADNKDGANFTNTIFDDKASVTIQDGSAPYTGIFKPESPLAPLLETIAKGVWTLRVIDRAIEDTGKLTSWSINIEGIVQEKEAEEVSNKPKPFKAFSPNNDGINDTWQIENINTLGNESDYPSAMVTIFNQQGRIVYQTNFYKNDWDGTDKNGKKLPVGIYSYHIQFSDPNIHQLQGQLYLKH